jgi:hypothetical protein
MSNELLAAAIWLLHDRIVAYLFYGGSLAITLVLVHRSRSRPLAEISACVALAWVSDNIAFILLGPQGEPPIAAAVDAAAGSMVAIFSFTTRSQAGWWVYRIFVISGCVVVAGYLSGIQGSTLSLAILNILFIARLLVLGGASVVLLGVRVDRRDREPAIAGMHRTIRRQSNPTSSQPPAPPPLV